MSELMRNKKQVLKSEQILPNKSLILDYDQPLISSKNILQVLKESLGNEVFLIKYQKTKNVYAYKHDNRIDFLLCGAITYLSKPHPVFKKRLQLKKWFKSFYNEYSPISNTSVKLIGIYHYDGLVLFVNFKIEDYIDSPHGKPHQWLQTKQTHHLRFDSQRVPSSLAPLDTLVHRLLLGFLHRKIHNP